MNRQSSDSPGRRSVVSGRGHRGTGLLAARASLDPDSVGCGWDFSLFTA
jgi:hypothetical protein